MKSIGLIQVYTGDGKGKTTAAVGLAIRALGHGFKVCYISFHKNPEKWGYSEHAVLKKNGADVFALAGKHSLCNKRVHAASVREDCLKGLGFIKEILKGKKYDLLIIDEINISLRGGYLKTDEVISLLQEKPPDLEVVLTGRGAPVKLIKFADLVSRIKKVKHPYDKSIKRRKGIEY
ncbi:MAG: cob(I)yrinic acid a,c-diamide adenosyltransferase [Candidatus Omnitrophica bacterium]|nr:cob(I)yrinic acid a,c-diamide adenosyltransferase [Candidatus Omnitrophota bacterium]